VQTEERTCCVLCAARGGSPTPTAFIDAHAPTRPSSRLVCALLAPVSPGGEVQ
jgi:hypothetical protein